MRTKLAEAKWIGAAAAVAVVIGLTVGGTAAIKMAGGGGAQPEDVLPANAIAFAKLDLNPSAGQKVAVYRLASKFPKVKDKVTSEDTSIKESIFGSIFTGPTSESGLGLDYKKDVEPWLGDRVGVAVFPDLDGDKEPEVGIAVAVTDEKAAKVALDKAIINAAKTPAAEALLPGMPAPVKPSGYAFTEGYVILSDTTAHATKLAQAGKAGSLADSKYADDVKELGTDQIGVAWADIAAVYKAIPSGGLNAGAFGMLDGGLKGANDPKNASGRVVVSLHADPSFVEVTGRGIDLKGLGSPPKSGSGTAMIASFPADVFGAVSVTGLGTQLAALYTTITAEDDPLGVKPQLNQLGISSVKDIETLFGTETGVVVSGTKDSPEFAVRTRGADADAALAIAGRVVNGSGAGGMVTATKVTGPDGIVVGYGPGLIAAVSNKSGSRLGGTEAFKQVMPGADKADYAAYVDLAKVIAALGEDPEDAASLKPFKALGMTATYGADSSFRLRVSVR